MTGRLTIASTIVVLALANSSTAIAQKGDADHRFARALSAMRKQWTWSASVKARSGSVFPADDARVNALASGPRGETVAGGAAVGRLIPGAPPFRTDKEAGKSFVTKLDQRGRLQWTKVWDWGRCRGSPDEDNAFHSPCGVTALAVGRDGTIVVAGSFRAKQTDANAVVVLAKLDTTGRLLWTADEPTAHPMPMPWYGPFAVTLLQHGDIAIAGCELGMAPSRSKGHPEYPARRAFIARYTSAGERKWHRLVRIDASRPSSPSVPADDPSDCLTAVAAGPDDDLFAAGTYRGGLAVGTDLHLDDQGTFLVRYKHDGQPRWIRAVGPGLAPVRLAPLPAGHVAVSGALAKGRNNNPAPGLAGYGSDGERRWLLSDVNEPSGLRLDRLALTSATGTLTWAAGLVGDVRVGEFRIAADVPGGTPNCALVSEVTAEGAVVSVRVVRGYECQPTAVTVGRSTWLAGIWQVEYFDRGIFVHRLPANASSR